VGMRGGQADAGQFGFQLVAARARIGIDRIHFRGTSPHSQIK
jgi:hypothetical protein